MMYNNDVFLRVKKIVADFLKHEGIGNCHIAVALSGGADSVCLLHTLNVLQRDFQLCVSAIHVNHGIRGEEAAGDEAFCRSLCSSLALPLEVYKVDVPAHAEKKHLSMESAARELRYDCFEKFLSENQETLIATAHQADDNAETVLFRMVRGTGLRGLCGIPARREHYIRPLLGVTGKEIRDALVASDAMFCVDSTNADTAYSRNFIRHEVLPQLETLHEHAGKNISLMTEGLAEDEEYLCHVAEEMLSFAQAGHLRSAVATAPRAIAKRMIRRLYEEKKRSDDALTAQQLSAALNLIRGKERFASQTLPCGVEMRVENDNLLFDYAKEIPVLQTHVLHYGVNLFSETGECMIVSEKPVNSEKFPELNIYKLLIQSTLQFDTMNVHLFVRGRQEGDAYRYGGMTHRVRKLYNDKKLSPKERAVRPVLCDEKGILWIPGFGVREDSNEKKEHCLYVCYCSGAEAN